jgi:hypothetical protein
MTAMYVAPMRAYAILTRRCMFIRPALYSIFVLASRRFFSGGNVDVNVCASIHHPTHPSHPIPKQSSQNTFRIKKKKQPT